MRRIAAALCLWACACAEPAREESPPRKSPPGAVPRERAVDLERALPQLTMELLRKGQQRYAVDCEVCHGVLGDGDTEAARAFTEHKPGSLHDERIRALSDEDLFNVIGRGSGSMLAFPELSTEERWAIVGYVRALQLSQHATLDLAPPEVQSRLNPLPPQDAGSRDASAERMPAARPTAPNSSDAGAEP